jgi:hypothetical protein
MKEEVSFASLLIELIQKLPESLLQSLPKKLKDIFQQGYNRITIKPKLAKYIQEISITDFADLLKVFQSAVQTITQTDDEELKKKYRDWKFKAELYVAPLVVLLSHLPNSLIPEVLRIVCTIKNDFNFRSLIIIKLIPYLSESLLSEIINSFSTIKDNTSSKHQSDSERFNYVLFTASISSCLSQYLLQDIGYWPFSQILEKAAPCISSETLLSQVIHAAQIATSTLDDYPLCLHNLALHLPQAMLPKLLEIAYTISDTLPRAGLFVGLAKRLPNITQEAFQSAVCAMHDSKGWWLGKLVSYYPELLSDALKVSRAACATNDSAIMCLAGGMPDHFLFEIIDEIVCDLPETYFLERLKRTILYNSTRYFITKVINSLSPHVSESFFAQALDIACENMCNEHHAKLLYGLAAHLPQNLLPKAIKAAFEFKIHIHWVHKDTLDNYLEDTLNNLVSRLDKVDSILLDSFFAEFLTAIGELSEWERGTHLGQIAPYLTNIYLEEAFKIACEIKDSDDCTEALIALMPYLPSSLLIKAVELRCTYSESLFTKLLEILRVYGDSACLYTIAPRLSEKHFAEIFASIDKIHRDHSTQARKVLISQIPESLLPQALQWIPAIQKETEQAEVLGEIASRIPETKFSDVLEISQQILPVSLQSRILNLLISRLEQPSVYFAGWCDILHILSQNSRKELLENIHKLVPAIAKLGGVEAIAETVRAVEDVKRQWQ